MARNERKMVPLEIDQVGIVVRDIDKAISQLQSLLGIGPFETREIDRPDAIVHGKQTRVRAKLAFAQAGPVQLELIEPGEGENTYTEFLRSKGEGVHHFGIIVTDMERELARFREKGIKVLQSQGSARGSVAYLDTEELTGVILELRHRKHSS